MNEVRLKVPYLSQLDNNYKPYGTCNTTSLAMCMAYFGHQKIDVNGVQLEDELTDYCFEHKLSRHSPYDLKVVLERYGYKDDFQEHATWDAVKKWLDAGKPCILHGYFTAFGHIVVIIGYNEEGFVINDPYGEYWEEGGYDTSVSGAGLTYSYKLLQRLCSPDGKLFIHYVSK